MARRVVLGVCAMDVKARSRPMRNILDRLLRYGDFDVVLFGDQVITEECIEQWPLCDVLIAFFSRGFPLAKAIAYVNLRKPFCLNDLPLQHLLLDRRLVLQVLDAIDVPTPARLVLARHQSAPLPAHLVDTASRNFNIDLVALTAPTTAPVSTLNADTLQVGRHLLRKPFVEKPVSAEDHNIYIYYPQAAGGGARKLFRKVANKSSEFYPDCVAVRQDGSYIYEEFIDAEGLEDIKVYTVGLHYAHAEKRKYRHQASPPHRPPRSPVVDGVVRRNADGKELRVVADMTPDEQEIARRVCMAFGQTICGFDIIRSKGRSYVVDVNGWSFVKGNDEYYDRCASILRETFLHATLSTRLAAGPLHARPSLPAAAEGQWRLKTYVSVFRHGDRTPKQKLKLTVRHPAFFALLPPDSPPARDVLIRDRDLLVKAHAISHQVLLQTPAHEGDLPMLRQLAQVLASKMHTPGTKLQLRKILKGDSPSMLLIVKWGGDYTHAGRHHTKDLGESMRKELAILNRELLEDVKIFCSAERRVLATADVFAKALLATAEVAPHCISTLKDLLDDNFKAKDDIYIVKRRIGERLVKAAALRTPPLDDPAPFLSGLKECMALHRQIMQENFRDADIESLPYRWCCSDSPSIFKERWERHFSDVLDGCADWFDPSKISDLYDSLKFDALHHRDFLEAILARPRDEASNSSLHRMYMCAQKLFDYLAPREYGETPEERFRIGSSISGGLLHRIVNDLRLSQPASVAPATRLYFTKESHMTALLNIIRNCEIPISASPSSSETHPDEVCQNELDYLSHICFEFYERTKCTPTADGGTVRTVRYSLRIGLSNGAHNPRLLDLQLDSRHALSVTSKRWLTGYMEGLGALDKLENVSKDGGEWAKGADRG